MPGERIIADRYRIGRLLGAGGMGEVYEAKHVVTDHAVAIKLLRSAAPVDASSAPAELALEAKIDARVRSKHIVHVQDAGVDKATGCAYLVMELLQGTTLARRIERSAEGRLAVGDVLGWLQQMARGLDAAHALGVVHRDLKPENVFVTTSSTVKILDFGIAKILDAADSITLEMKGTPLYMAPEQVRSDAVSAQTDIWALGLLAHRALTGRSYWRCANTGQPSALAQMVFEITMGSLEPPSERLAAQGVHVELPAAFDTWFMRCIERQPSARFETAGEAVRALKRAWAGAPRGVLPMRAPSPSPAAAGAPTPPTRVFVEVASEGKRIAEEHAAGEGYAGPAEQAFRDVNAADTASGVSVLPLPRARRRRVLVASLALAAAGVAAAFLRYDESAGRVDNAAVPLAALADTVPGTTPAQPIAPAPPTLDATQATPLSPAAPDLTASNAAPPPSAASRGAARKAKRESSTSRTGPPRVARVPASSTPQPAQQEAARAQQAEPPPARVPPTMPDPYGLTPSQLFGASPKSSSESTPLPQGTQGHAERGSSSGNPPP